MSKRYRPWKIDEPMLLPATVQEFVDKDHLARFVLSLVDGGGLDGLCAGLRLRPQQAGLRTNIRFKFQAMVTRLHSLRTFSSPRSEN